MESSNQSQFVQFLQKAKRSRGDRGDKLLGGICSGFAAHSDIPVWVYRVGFIALSAMSVGVFAYIALWIFMPIEEYPVSGEPKVD